MSKRRSRAMLLATATLLAIPAFSQGAGVRTKLTSVGPEDTQVQGSASTYWRSLSGDGKRAVFTVDDDDLPGEDGTRDVYVRNLESGKTKLVSRASSGEVANETSGDDPAISADGRFVAFSTSSTNLPGGEGGIFVRNLEQETTRLVSTTAQGEPADGSSTGRPGLSADGRFVAFEANDDDFPGADGTLDAYVHNRESDKTQLITKSTAGVPVDTNSVVQPAISGNGRYVTFSSDSNLLPGADGTTDLFIRDRGDGTTTLVSRTPGGEAAGNSLGNAGAISFDGRFVAFESSAASLGADPSGSTYVRDRKRGTTKLASVTGTGEVAIGNTASISANGCCVVYESEDDDLPGLDGTTDVFRYELKTEKTILVSRSNGADAAGDDSFYASISGGGGFVAFSSRGDNLSNDDDDAYTNTFVRGPLG